MPASVDSTLVPRRCPPRALLIAPSATVALTLDRAAGPAAASALPKILALYAAGSLLLPLLPHLCTRASQPVAVPRGRSAAACRVFTPTPAPMRRRLTLTEFECEPSLLCVFTTQLGSLARERWEKMLPRLHNYLVKAHLSENVRDPIARSSQVVTTLQSPPIFSTTGNQRSLTPGHGLLPVTSRTCRVSIRAETTSIRDHSRLFQVRHFVRYRTNNLTKEFSTLILYQLRNSHRFHPFLRAARR